MKKHNWQNGKCTLCKISMFMSSGVDNEKPWKNWGLPEDQYSSHFYLLNDGRATIVDKLPECEGDVPEIKIEFKVKTGIE